MKVSKLTVPVIALSAVFAAGCDVDQTQKAELPDVSVTADSGQLPKYEVKKTQEGRLPDVDADIKGGKLPKFDIDGPSVTVGEKRVGVNVPDVDVDVDTERHTFSVPTIDVDLPDDDDDTANN